MQWILLAGAALGGSTLAGITGFGGAAVLLPVLVAIFGVRDAIPILAVAQLIGNGSRVFFHRHELDWKVVRYFSVSAIPSALIGGFFFAKAPAPVLIRFLGPFLLLTVLWRWVGTKRVKRMPVRGFIGVGLGFSFLSALVGSVGPFIVPFFLAYGLVKGAFIGTEALCTVVMHVFKIAAYHQTSLLTEKMVYVGLAVGPVMILGSWLGKQIVKKLPERVFLVLVEATLVLAGLNFLIRG